jgi:hypothetical protein
MYRYFGIALILLSGLSAFLDAQPAFEGQLFRRGSQKQERLFSLRAERAPERWVDAYADAQGHPAVIERVYFAGGQPTRYEFDDRQRGGLGLVTVEGAELELSWSQDGRSQRKRVAKPADLIFGPLYPGLLAQRWEALLAGQNVVATVPVLSAERLMTASLAFRRAPKKDRGDGSLCVEMKPANWFVALFFPPIDLHLDPASRRLLNVQGTSLLREKVDGEWKMTQVDLDYSY